MGLGALAYRYLQEKTRLHPVIIFPLSFVALWSLVPTLFFFNLANGTSSFTTALQPMEIFGTWGLDVIIILVNTLIYSILRYKKIHHNFAAMIPAAIIIIAWFTAGIFLFKGWKEDIASWQTKRIGIIQTHRPSSRYILGPARGFTSTYPLAMDMSLKLAPQKPDIVIWPEGNLYKYFEDLEVHEAFMKNINKLGAPLLFHDYPFDFKDGKTLFRNSSVMINGDGSYIGRYNKRFIVPFGEYIPFLDYDGKIARMFNVPPPIAPGDKPGVYEVSGMKIQTLICYEIQFTEFVAQSVGTNPAGRVITVQSNDGWYGTGGAVFQHNSSVALRAVEHRLPVVHVLNNGPSTVVLPDGNTIFMAPFWERGSWVIEMPYNDKKGGTFYTQHPGMTLMLVRFLFFTLLIYALKERILSVLPFTKKDATVEDAAGSLPPQPTDGGL